MSNSYITYNVTRTLNTIIRLQCMEVFHPNVCISGKTNNTIFAETGGIVGHLTSFVRNYITTVWVLISFSYIVVG